MMLRNQIDAVAGAMSRRDWLVRSANGFGGLVSSDRNFHDLRGRIVLRPFPG